MVQGPGNNISTFLSLNANTVPYSNFYLHLGAYQVLTGNYILGMTAGDYFEILWNTNSTSVALYNSGSSGTSGSTTYKTPSAIVTIQRLST